MSNLRILSWNCNLRLEAKFEKIAALSPDIAIIQECERMPPDFFPDAQYLWVGQNEKKGLGVLIFGGTGTINTDYNSDLIEFLPVDTDFGSILAVWAFNHRAQKRYGRGFDGQISSAISHYKGFLEMETTLGAVGDFNNSVIWDTANSKKIPFRRTIEQLESYGLVSAYHHARQEEFGEENEASLYHTKNREKRYHIDYLFLRTLGNVSVGSFEDWISESDHVPVIVDLKG